MKRAELTIQQLKVTLLVDTKLNTILDLRVAATRKHNRQVVPLLIKRGLKNIDILLSNRGFDDQKARRFAYQHEVRLLIKHRNFISFYKI